MRALGGIPPVDKKFAQFILNDRKVLRFKARQPSCTAKDFAVLPGVLFVQGYWDDHTPYGTSNWDREWQLVSCRSCLAFFPPLRILFHPPLLFG